MPFGVPIAAMFTTASLELFTSVLFVAVLAPNDYWYAPPPPPKKGDVKLLEEPFNFLPVRCQPALAAQLTPSPSTVSPRCDATAPRLHTQTASRLGTTYRYAPANDEIDKPMDVAQDRRGRDARPID